MLLVFPTYMGVDPGRDDVHVIRDLDQSRFNAAVAARLADGWTVHEMDSKFRRTLFGGVTAYRAELRRVPGGKKSKRETR